MYDEDDDSLSKTSTKTKLAATAIVSSATKLLSSLVEPSLPSDSSSDEEDDDDDDFDEQSFIDVDEELEMANEAAWRRNMEMLKSKASAHLHSWATKELLSLEWSPKGPTKVYIWTFHICVGFDRFFFFSLDNHSSHHCSKAGARSSHQV